MIVEQTYLYFTGENLVYPYESTLIETDTTRVKYGDGTTAYNDLADTYDSKLANYQSAADQFTAENKKLEEIKTEYEARNADLQKSTAELTEAGLKVADMGDNSKAAFEKLYNDGSSVTSALDAVSNIDKMFNSDLSSNSVTKY